MLPVAWDGGLSWPARAGWPWSADCVSENELLGCVAAQEPVDAVLGCDDFRAGGDVEDGLTGVAEPDAMAGADFQVDGRWTGTGSLMPRRAVQERQAVVARTGPRVSGGAEGW